MNIKTFKIVILPTKERSPFCFHKIIKKIFYENYLISDLEYKKDNKEFNESYIFQHLYILSDEEIKEGDYILANGDPYQVIDIQGINYRTSLCWVSNCKKIIATTDKSLGLSLIHINDPFLPLFIKSFNDGKQITEVDLEMEEIWIPSTSVYGHGDHNYKIKTLPDNTVIIHQPKTYSKEDIYTLCTKAITDACRISSPFGSQGMSKFEKEFLKTWLRDNIS